jgi:hypothetical protein
MFGSACFPYPAFVQCPEESGSILSWTALSYTTYLLNTCRGPDSVPAPPPSGSILVRQVGASAALVKWGPCARTPDALTSGSPIVEYIVELGTAPSVKKSVGLALSAVFEGVRLVNGQRVRALITCRNAAGLLASAYSPSVVADLTGPTITGVAISSLEGTPWPCCPSPVLPHPPPPPSPTPSPLPTSPPPCRVRRLPAFNSFSHLRRRGSLCSAMCRSRAGTVWVRRHEPAGGYRCVAGVVHPPPRRAGVVYGGGAGRLTCHVRLLDGVYLTQCYPDLRVLVWLDECWNWSAGRSGCVG